MDRQGADYKNKADGKGPTGDGKAKLYHLTSSRSARVVWLIEEIGVQDDFEIVDFNVFSATDEEKEKYKREVNPHGRIPSLVLPDGTEIIESASICMYIAQRYGKLLPEAGQEAAYFNWMVHGVGTIGVHLNQLLYPIFLKTPREPVLAERASKEVKTWLDSLEKHLKDGRQFICGKSFTAVDCVVGFTTMFCSAVEDGALFVPEQIPHVAAYLDRIKQRPAFSRNVMPFEKWPKLKQ